MICLTPLSCSRLISPLCLHPINNRDRTKSPPIFFLSSVSLGCTLQYGRKYLLLLPLQLELLAVVAGIQSKMCKDKSLSFDWQIWDVHLFFQHPYYKVRSNLNACGRSRAIQKFTAVYFHYIQCQLSSSQNQRFQERTVSAWEEFKFVQTCLFFLVLFLLSSTYCSVSGDVFLCVICGPGDLGGVRGAGLLREARLMRRTGMSRVT